MSCDILKALSGSPNRVVLTLEPGFERVETWDFSQCLDGSGQPEPIVAYTMFVTRPRAKNGALRALPGNVPLHAQLYKTRNETVEPIYSGLFHSVFHLGTVTNAVIKLILMLDESANKPLPVEITASCIIGAGSA